jgi:hypothetical protein
MGVRFASRGCGVEFKLRMPEFRETLSKPETNESDQISGITKFITVAIMNPRSMQRAMSI